MLRGVAMSPAARAAVGLVLLSSWCAGADEAAPGWLEANEVQYRGQLAELHYYEGETANFTCWRRLSASNASVQLSYYSDELTDTVSTTFQRQNSVEMYLKLRATHNDTIITCTIKDDSNNEVYIIQLHLLLRPLAYTLGFEVNGLQVRPRAGRPAGGVLYQYRYLRDERMTVRLVKDPREHGAARCDVFGKEFPESWLNHVNSAELLSSGEGVHLVNSSLLPQQSGATILCRVQRRIGPELVLALTFIIYELVPYVGGLTMANVELLYKVNITHVVYDNHTPYTGNDTHYLTYKAIFGVSTWAWDITAIDDNPDKIDKGYPYAFRMVDNISRTLLQYAREPGEGPGRALHLWLHRPKPPPPAPAQ